eukprot:CAMPEP_0179968610 /NCGR_PEP_ID=MMETSP0983-20121128/33996_1 /TAXON_ID=483367 /ORGANISM="non described non described, Strain CCMP 2436" /LENGTH=55 /DNA_ID=CAMNT_0021882499 /DNA_START=32 /DNA_END=196 /DNA_ORIENTATION=-
MASCARALRAWPPRLVVEGGVEDAPVLPLFLPLQRWKNPVYQDTGGAQTPPHGAP